MNRWILRAIWVPSLILLIAMTVVFAKTGPVVIAPAALKSVAVEDKSIALQAPGNWKPKIVSSHAVMSAITFTPDKTILFDVTTDLTGALMADISRAAPEQAGALQGLPGLGGSAGMLPTDSRKTPLEKLHDRQAAEIKEKYLDYTEGKTTKIAVAGQEALQTEFSCQTRQAWELHPSVGMRISALTGERRVSIEYRCREERKAALFPVFAKMVKSVQVGQ